MTYDDLLFDHWPPVVNSEMLTGRLPTGVMVTHKATGAYAVCDTEQTRLANIDIAVKLLLKKLGD